MTVEVAAAVDADVECVVVVAAAAADGDDGDDCCWPSFLADVVDC